MRAWQVRRPGPVATHPLVLGDVAVPVPRDDELLVQVTACGVCRTDLHVAEGDLPVHKPAVVPGHEIVGIVREVGVSVADWRVGERVGIAWLRRTCEVCRFCRDGRENLCVAPQFTGWDADGGYAEWAVVPAGYAYRLPDNFDDEHAAPLLCAGIIGYRALKVSSCPPGGSLGIWGFGASAHLAAQIALHLGARVHVRTRASRARALATELGVATVGDSADPLPEPLHSAILFAPAGELVPTALAALDRGGTLAVAGIHLTQIPALDYASHLFNERVLRSVTANTRADGREFLDLAGRIPVRVTTTAYAFEEADRALRDLANDNVDGAAVLRVGS